MASGSTRPVLHRALLILVKRTLRPLVKVALLYGMSCVEFEDVTRWVFVDVALHDDAFALPHRNKRFKSRAAILTGLSRKEVMRLSRQVSPGESGDVPCRNRAARVITGWYTAPYADSRGRPRVIPLKGAHDSFAGLVRQYSGDIPYRAIFDELLQRGVVEKTANGGVRLKAPGRLYPIEAENGLRNAADNVEELASLIEKQLNFNHTGR